MRYLQFLLIVVLAVLVSACNLAVDQTEEPINLTPTEAASGKPQVSIISPQNGDEFVVDDPVLISVNASDSRGVTRVQLLANDQIVKTVSSESSNGDPNMNVLLDYKPRAAGTVNLSVLAYRNTTSSDPAQVQIVVRTTESQITATPQSNPSVPVIDPNDPTCRALINSGLNFRTGPATNYNIIRVLGAGEVIPITGRLGDNSWWQLNTGQLGWVSAQYTTIYGNCGGIPVAVPPPSPTPQGGGPTNTPTNTPTPTLTFTPTLTPTPGTPDLVVVSIVGPDTVTIPSGQSSVTQTYSVTISNTGTGSTTQFANTVTVSPGGSALDLGTIGSLDKNQSITLTINLTFSAAGSYTVLARVDSDSQISEISEVNNTGSIAVTVSS